ncbi:HD domain-containing protein [Gorillibacterium massiliense]|uniref:CTP synthase C-terminal region-related (seleno)protein n=1 Tax=Gorillibacterium massiliense TaxID=1280390 RepID=UPI0004AF6F27|nr:HD domain-containing protein [Gorillibacterium massiliense]
MLHIGLIGDYNPQVVAHKAIPEAIRLAAVELGYPADFEWIPTPELDRDYEEKLAKFHAIWTVPASPYASMTGALNGIRYARERKLPFLGTCGGCQHMILEFARNVLGLTDADHAEENPTGSLLMITPLSCSVNETVHTFHLSPGSKVAAAYGSDQVTEQYGRCNYGPNPEFAPMLEQAGLRTVGTESLGEPRIMELAGYSFYVGTLFQPERSALRGIVHPLILAYLRAAANVAVMREAERFARAELEADTTGHDWWHIHRVRQSAEKLAAAEGADRFICVTAALLHDVADEKLNDSKESGLQKVQDWLDRQPVTEEDRRHIMEIIANLSYNAGTNPPMRTLEGMVVQDADRLDAIGAIAIARTFLYSGHIGRPIYDPTILPRETMTREEYRHGKSTAINHFHEKLFKLRDRINTATAKAIAEERHRFMEGYVEQFMLEWDGQD